ncbi:hypothetical protein [Sporohalobacter salinus]|uniref:hypothetical protein n=1 Tax=Sporohalobacter salinus TaxID=1494606 RepID=UPI0019621170|nr:hypothetical protein [Sporohalobacter salinus]MBM7623709.1 hypothetical protein [Sporohalobacter salinus]
MDRCSFKGKLIAIELPESLKRSFKNGFGGTARLDIGGGLVATLFGYIKNSFANAEIDLSSGGGSCRISRLCWNGRLH